MQVSSKDLSIIIPVYNSMDLLPRCVESILNQTIDLSRVEVLLVDDGSTDGSGKLCDKYKKEYPDLFRVIHQANSGGPAQPRNRGIAAAQGEYIFFCDNDDYFGLEAFERMLDHAFEWNSDVLLCKMGETGRRFYPRSMFKQNSPCVSPYSSNILKTLGPWKLYRRSLLIDNDCFFPEHCSLDDSVFTLKAYLCADTISVAADCDYYYWTIRRDGGNLSTLNKSNESVWFDISARNAGCKLMLDLVQERVPRRKRKKFYVKIIGDLVYYTMRFACLGDDKKVTENLLVMREFMWPYYKSGCCKVLPFYKQVVFACLMNESSAGCVKQTVITGYGRKDFKKYKRGFMCPQAMECGVECFGCNTLVKKANRRACMKVFKKARKIVLRYAKRIVKDVALSVYFPHIYKKAARQGVNDRKVIFLENKQASMPDSFKVLHGYLDDNYEFDLTYISLAQNRVRWRQYFKNCCEMVREIATAKYVFLNDASDVVSCLPMCEETKVTQLWHACGAFKKWGMSTADLIFGGSKEDLLRHPFYKNLSLVTVSSPEISWAYVEAMVLEDRPYIVKPLGVSRTDLFFDEGYINAAKSKMRRYLPETKGKKVILYAPTFRGRVIAAKAPNQLDIERFNEAFSDNYVLLIKHHPFVKSRPKIPESCKGFALDVSEDIPIDELLICADICISDYSSLVFEYSLMLRPMLFFAYDIDEYSDWRGFYYDYNELTPGPVYSTNDQMIDYIQNLSLRFDRDKVVAFRNRFMSACDGHATIRICREVFGDDLKRFRVSKSHDIMQEEPSGIDVSMVISK